MPQPGIKQNDAELKKYTLYAYIYWNSTRGKTISMESRAVVVETWELGMQEELSGNKCKKIVEGNGNAPFSLKENYWYIWRY